MVSRMFRLCATSDNHFQLMTPKCKNSWSHLSHLIAVIFPANSSYDMVDLPGRFAALKWFSKHLSSPLPFLSLHLLIILFNELVILGGAWNTDFVV